MAYNEETYRASSKAINAKIKQISVTGKKFNDLVHETMVMVAKHALTIGPDGIMIGDVTGAARLVDAMPMSNRRSLVIDHFAQYTPIKVVKDAKSGAMRASLRRPEEKGYIDWNVEGLEMNRWDERPEVQNEPDILTYSGAKDAIFKLLKSLDKKAEKSNDENHIKALLRKVRVGLISNDDTDDGVAAPTANAA